MDKQSSFIHTGKNLDPIGEKTLQAIAGAENFNKWMYNTVRPYLKGHVLEIGSGIGNISSYIIYDFNTMLSDLRQHYCDQLGQKFAHNPHLIGINTIDLTHPNFDTEYKALLGSFDSIIALNVVEHIEDDSLAMQNCFKLLRNKGNVVILVPSYQWLYNQFDKGLEHFRRYTTTRLKKLISAAGFHIAHAQYFNLAGILGWYVSGNLLKKESIPEGQMGLYNSLVPAFKVLDKIALNKIGLSTIVVGTKNE